VSRLRPALLALVSSLAASALHAQAPSDHLLLAVSQGDSALAIFKVADRTLTPVKTLPIGKTAREVCVAADGKRAYVTNDNDNTVTVVDLATLATTATFALPTIKRADGCTTSPDSRKLYVTGMESENFVVLAADSGKVLKDLPVKDEPRRVAFSPDGKVYYVSAEESENIMVFDAATDSPLGSLKSGGHGPRTMMFLPDKSTMLATNVDDDTLSFIKPATKEVTLTIGAGGSPQRLALSPDGQSAYVMSVLEHKISVVDLKGPHIRARKFVTVGEAPWGMVGSDDRSLLFVGSSKENTITVYDGATLEKGASVSVKRPMGLAYR
jgi:YVTN family beta-propeller protein